MKKEEFNLYEFHQLLSNMVSEESIDQLKIRLEEIQSKPSTVFEDELRFKQMSRDIQTKIQYTIIFHQYEQETIPIIDQFKKLLNCTIKDTFMKKKQTTSEINTKKVSLISEYLQIVYKYSVLSSYLPSFEEETTKQLICQDCKVELDCFEHSFICPICFVEQPHFYQDEAVSFKDLSRINTNVKYSYIRQTHFRDTIKQFQGKQNKYIDDKVYQTLLHCFESSSMKPLPNGKYNISKDHIKMFLQENSFYKYYEDINLIHYELTGIPCPDISSYEKQLIDDFDKFVTVYDKVIQNDYCNYTRSNILNSYYILFQLLKKNGYSCKESDFPIIKTVDRKIEHDEIYEKCCKQLGWFFHPTV
jgi:hypothetical protein